MISKLIKNLLGDNLSKNSKKYIIINYIIIAILLIFSIALLKFLPADIPMQWADDGTVKYTLPTIIGIWAPPAILLAVNVNLVKRESANIITTGVFAIVSLVVGYFYLKIIGIL